MLAVHELRTGKVVRRSMKRDRVGEVPARRLARCQEAAAAAADGCSPRGLRRLAQRSKRASTVSAASRRSVRTAASTRSGVSRRPANGWLVEARSRRPRASSYLPNPSSRRPSAHSAKVPWFTRPRACACASASPASCRQSSSRPCVAATNARVPSNLHSAFPSPVSRASVSPSLPYSAAEIGRPDHTSPDARASSAITRLPTAPAARARSAASA